MLTNLMEGMQAATVHVELQQMRTGTVSLSGVARGQAAQAIQEYTIVDKLQRKDAPQPHC